MKKVMVMFCFILSMFLCACSEQRNARVLDDLDSHSNFKYQLNSTVTDEIKAEYSVNEGFGGYMLVDPRLEGQQGGIFEFMNENATTYYDVSGYPDCLDDAVITRILTSDPSIDVYGYSVGDSFDEESVISFMSTIGFAQSESDVITFENEDVRISFVLDDENIIDQISVRLVSNCDVIF